MIKKRRNVRKEGEIEEGIIKVIEEMREKRIGKGGEE